MSDGRPRLAFVTPLPPAPTGVAYHSLRLAEELAATGAVDLDLFAEEPQEHASAPVGPPGIDVFSAGSLAEVESVRGRYDKLLLALGNSDHHIAALELLRRRSGVVLAHEVRLTNLYYFAAERRSAAVPDGFSGALRRIYGNELPPGLGERRLYPFEEERYGILMAREVIEWSERYLVTSRAARALATLDAGADASGKIGVVPFAAELPIPGQGGFDSLAAPGPAPPARGSPLVVTLGILHPVRQPLRLLDAFARAHELVPEARLAYVGAAPEDMTMEVLQGAERLGISAAVAVTGRLGTERYAEWIRSATIAVQLRDYWNGEASHTVGECLVTGVPVVVSDLGWSRELPDGCVMKLDPRATSEELGTLIARLLQDRALRAALSEGALAFAPRLSYERAAEAVLNELLSAETSEAGARREH
jgi:glycosyltransferase involved in cell wall biosynthesis